MKQVGRYSKFLFSIVFRRWSYYVTTSIYLLVLVAVLFLISAVLRKPVVLTLQYYGFTSMAILAGAITAAVYTVQLFRAGIDDGTELLITAKPIKRNEMLGGKCIVLFTLILIISFLSMCLGFLTYYTNQGEKTFTYIGGGAFLTTFLILLFFSGVAIVFCLITKKIGATLATIGTCFAFMIYSFMDTILSNGPATYVEEKNVNIQPTALVSEINSQNNTYQIKSLDGVIAKNRKTNTAINQYVVDGKVVQASTDFLANLWNRALLGTSRNAMMTIDPIYQWSTLINIDNYLDNSLKHSSLYYRYVFNEKNISINNIKFSTKPIDLNKFINWNINNKDITGLNEFLLGQSEKFNFFYRGNNLFLDKYYADEIDDTIYIPNFVPSNIQSTNSITFNTFSIKENNWQAINNLIFNNNQSSIINKYLDIFKTLIQGNLLVNSNRITTLSALQAYLNVGFIQILNNPDVFNKIANYIKKQKINLELVNIADLNVVLNLLKNKPQQVFENIFFMNKLTMNTLKQIQLVAYNYVKNVTTNYQDKLYVNAMKVLGVDSIVPTINFKYTSFIGPYWLLEGLLDIASKKIEPTNPLFGQLTKLASYGTAVFNEPPLYAINKYNLATFTTAQVVPYISLGGLLGVWFSLTFMFLVIGIILYSRKDFI